MTRYLRAERVAAPGGEAGEAPLNKERRQKDREAVNNPHDKNQHAGLKRGEAPVCFGGRILRTTDQSVCARIWNSKKCLFVEQTQR